MAPNKKLFMLIVCLRNYKNTFDAGSIECFNANVSDSYKLWPLRITFSEENYSRETEGVLNIFTKEGVMYSLYPLGFVAAILIYYLLDYVDQKPVRKAAKIHKAP